MKHLILAVVMVPSFLFARSPQPIPGPPPQPIPMPPSLGRVSQSPADALPDNYQVTLTIADKDGQPLEVSLVVAAVQFNTSLGEHGLTFSGNVSLDESGGIVVAYALGWETPVTTGNSTQYKSSATQGSVRLKLGEEVQIIRAGTRTARLSVKSLEASKTK
ncbi:MAG TPA: hypothetical protein VIM57_11365 [Luteolibacter sp.]